MRCVGAGARVRVPCGECRAVPRCESSIAGGWVDWGVVMRMEGWHLAGRQGMECEGTTHGPFAGCTTRRETGSKRTLYDRPAEHFSRVHSQRRDLDGN